MASNFIYSNRDLKFIIKEWLDSAKIFGFEKYRDCYSLDDVDVILDQALKIVAQKVAPTNEDGDTIQARFDNGKVTVPPSFHELYKFLITEGWGVTNLLEENAEALPQLLYAAVLEMIVSGNPAFVPYINLTGGVLELIQNFGSEWDKKTFLPRLCDAEWTGTMCLTEAGGGSDVGDILSKAYPTDEAGIYKIKGAKIFITAGDHDICNNIIHMALARIDGSVPGTKGISLFIVPKIWVNPDGSLGEDNDVATICIEHKMGITGSATAQLSFGENNGCRGILVGSVPVNGQGEGMAQMFQMMNGARMDTGVAAYSLAAQAYFNATQYARDRVQGRLSTDPKGGRVPIIEHADIKRMLLDIKSSTEAMRAMAYKTYYYFDLSHHSPDESERQMAEGRSQVLTPLVKAYCSDMAWPLIAEAIQVYGGYGYLEEYPVAQLARDCKIYSLWEGTNYIQSMDLVGRKWNLNKGQVFQGFLDYLDTVIKDKANRPEFATEAAIMSNAMQSYNHIRTMLDSYGKEGKPHMLSLYATRILHATAQLFGGTLLLDQAALASDKIAELGQEHWDFAFYQGKVDSARYFIKNTVPQIFMLEFLIETGDDSAVTIPEASLGV